MSHEVRAEVGYAVHFEGVAARMVGERKAEQYGWGGGGLATPELTIGGVFGIELALGGFALADGGGEEDGVVPTGGGYGLVAMPGLRLRPFGRGGDDGVFSASGLWIAGGGGLAYTGALARPAIDARIGYDLFAGDSLRVGPSIGFMQIVETESEVRPEDARMVLFGLHAAFEPTAAAPAPATGRRVDHHAAVPVVRDEDGESVVGSLDACPADPETVNGYADDDGCPDELMVRVVGSEILLDERVHFAVNTSEVSIQSWPLLERVAHLLQQNPQYTRVRVQGHADDTGTEQYNQGLSERRSHAVRDMLAGFGVERARLVVEGFGELRPREPGANELVRRKNRRVEFLILERGDGAGE
jgi:outer membrane protein OmpA-like peptidoglycan-associated protein